MLALSKVVGLRSAGAALALAGVLTMVGCGDSSPSSNATATPAFSPAGGTYNTSQTVTVTDATGGAVLYCTTDGTMPTTSSSLCSQPVTVYKSEILQAMAVAPGKTASAVGVAGYTINLTAAATPTFSPAGGSYSSQQTVTIADTTPGANIYYTTDGTVPNSSSTLYTGPIPVAKSQTISAVAMVPGFSAGGVASATYTISAGTPGAPATPTFSPAGGSYSSAQTVTISDATAGAAIFYTVNGSAPSAASTPYTAPIAVPATETINAIAINSSGSSPVATAAYTISTGGGSGVPVAPVFSPAGGSYSSQQMVTISDATAGAAIFYTVNGSVPSASSTPYAGPITVPATETINAIAINSSGNSAVATAVYTIAAASIPAPTFSPAGGTFSSSQTVIVTPGMGSTNGALYYTTDASTPTAASMPVPLMSGSYSITVSQTETVKAVFLTTSGTSSAVGSATYTIDRGMAAPPVLSVASGSYASAQTETITAVTPGAPIYYTTDGSTPSATSGTLYTAPFSIGKTETVNAIAVGAGYSASTVVTASYTITLGTLALSGTVLSGTAPVAGAQVQLYAAGQTGYGSAATALLATPVATSSSGAFTFGVNCPAAPGNQVYLVATGGSAGAGANASLQLMAALGSCGSLTSATAIKVNEATTVASAYALSPFMTAAPNVGSSATNAQGLANAFKTVANMVNIGTGQALSITPAYAANPVAYLNSSTVPQARIDTLANLLNGCASTNGSSGGCANLFSAAMPAGGTLPTNTLQAILDIAQTPGNNVAALYGLASPTGPFQPKLAAAPNDWTMALTFTGGGLGIAPGTKLSGQSKAFPLVNAGLAIDTAGDIWTTAVYNGGPTGQMIVKFNPQGAPLTPTTTLSAATPPVASFGGFFPSANGPAKPDAIAFDPAGNFWVGGLGGYYSEISPTFVSLANGKANLPDTIAFDLSGNAWLGGDYVNEFDSKGSLLLTSNGVSAANSYGYSQLAFLTFDSNGGLWGVDNDGFGDLYQINTSDGTTLSDPFFTSGGAFTPLVADGSGNIYGCGSGTGKSLNVFNASSKNIVNSYPIASGRGCGGQMALDGAGHIFAVTGNKAPGIVDEFTTTGVAISPATGYTGTSSGEPLTINPDATIPYTTAAPPPGGGVAGAAVDGSGNLWVLNFDTGVTTASAGNVLVQFVGLAAPAVTPTSVALQNGKIGARP